jgi:hypothetical protein
MRDGYHVTITNRLEDLPPWFELHPTEVCDDFVHRLMAKLAKGGYPPQPLDGPNLWRAKAGDRLAWIGTGRPERDSVGDILAIIDFRNCALVIGEGDRGDVTAYLGYGRLTTPEMKIEDVERCRVAVAAVKRLGLPRTWGPSWMLG